MELSAVVVAAGTGSRYGAHTPKQYHMLGNRPVLSRTLDRLNRHPRIGHCVVVINKSHRDLYDTHFEPGQRDTMTVIEGGSTRSDSVHAGLRALKQRDPSHVLIHDGARPLLSETLIDRVADALVNNQGAVPVIRLSDALWSVANGRLKSSVDKSGLVNAQTPQGFEFAGILDAYENRAGIADDCAGIAIAAGLEVVPVKGDRSNLKITTGDDMPMARSIMEGFADIRTGQGIDIHAFCPGEGFVLYGIPVAADFGLLGHSDADAGLHSIADAIYGALAKGDIGVWFPPDDETWLNADSSVFITHARELLRNSGYAITAIDSTVVSEKPRISNYSDRMRQRVAELLEIDIDRVSIKGTTSEQIGFLGREEGLMATTIATLCRR